MNRIYKVVWNTARQSYGAGSKLRENNCTAGGGAKGVTIRRYAFFLQPAQRAA